MSLVVWCAAAVLGGVGAVMRFLVDGIVSQRLARDFPYGNPGRPGGAHGIGICGVADGHAAGKRALFK